MKKSISMMPNRAKSANINVTLSSQPANFRPSSSSKEILRKSFTGPDSPYSSVRLASSMRSLSQMSTSSTSSEENNTTHLPELVRPPHSSATPQPTHYCCTHTPRNTEQNTIASRIVIKRTTVFTEPQESFRVRDGRGGSNWRHVRQATDINNSRILYIDGSIKESDNQLYPPHLYSPVCINESLLKHLYPDSGSMTQGLRANRVIIQSVPPSEPKTQAISEEKKDDTKQTEPSVQVEEKKTEDVPQEEIKQDAVSQIVTKTNDEDRDMTLDELMSSIPKIVVSDVLKQTSIQQQVKPLDDEEAKIEAPKKEAPECALITLLEQKFTQLDLKVNLLRDNYQGDRYFDKVMENVVNCYNFEEKVFKINERNMLAKKRLEKSSIKLFKLIEKMKESTDQSTEAFNQIRGKLLSKIYHYRFYQDLGKILLKNIQFGQLVYINELDMAKRVKYIKYLNVFYKRYKRALKLLDLKNQI